MPSTTIGRGATSQPISLSASEANLSGGKSIDRTIEGINKKQKNDTILFRFKDDPLTNEVILIKESIFIPNLSIF